MFCANEVEEAGGDVSEGRVNGCLAFYRTIGDFGYKVRKW